MYLNPTLLIKKLGIDLGITHTALEIAGETMLEIIRTESLPTFSKFFPRPLRISFKVDDPDYKYGDNKMGWFRIPEKIVRSDKLIGIKEIIPDSYMVSRDSYLAYNTDIYTRQAQADFLSAFTLPTTVKFHPPNVMELKPKNLYYRSMVVDLLLMHDKNFFTINTTYSDEFLKLALIDVKRFLYGIRKNFPSVSTVFGSLEFDMETVQGMEDRRNDLLEYWRSQYFKDPNRRRIYFT